MHETASRGGYSGPSLDLFKTTSHWLRERAVATLIREAAGLA